MSHTQGISQVFTATLKSGDRFDYTQWRQEGLPKISLKELAEAATKESMHASTAFNLRNGRFKRDEMTESRCFFDTK